MRKKKKNLSEHMLNHSKTQLNNNYKHSLNFFKTKK